MAVNPFYAGYIPEPADKTGMSPFYPGYYQGEKEPKPFQPRDYVKPIEYPFADFTQAIDDMAFDIEGLPGQIRDEIINDFKNKLKATIKPVNSDIGEFYDYDYGELPGAFGVNLSLNPLDWVSGKGTVSENFKTQVKNTLNDWVKAGTGVDVKDLAKSNFGDFATKYSKDAWEETLLKNEYVSWVDDEGKEHSMSGIERAIAEARSKGGRALGEPAGTANPLYLGKSSDPIQRSRDLELDAAFGDVAAKMINLEAFEKVKFTRGMAQDKVRVASFDAIEQELSSVLAGSSAHDQTQFAVFQKELALSKSLAALEEARGEHGLQKGFLGIYSQADASAPIANLLKTKNDWIVNPDEVMSDELRDKTLQNIENIRIRVLGEKQKAELNKAKAEGRAPDPTKWATVTDQEIGVKIEGDKILRCGSGTLEQVQERTADVRARIAELRAVTNKHNGYLSNLEGYVEKLDKKVDGVRSNLTRFVERDSAGSIVSDNKKKVTGVYQDIGASIKGADVRSAARVQHALIDNVTYRGRKLEGGDEFLGPNLKREFDLRIENGLIYSKRGARGMADILQEADGTRSKKVMALLRGEQTERIQRDCEQLIDDLAEGKLVQRHLYNKVLKPWVDKVTTGTIIDRTLKRTHYFGLIVDERENTDNLGSGHQYKFDVKLGNADLSHGINLSYRNKAAKGTLAKVRVKDPLTKEWRWEEDAEYYKRVRSKLVLEKLKNESEEDYLKRLNSTIYAKLEKNRQEALRLVNGVNITANGMLGDKIFEFVVGSGDAARTSNATHLMGDLMHLDPKLLASLLAEKAKFSDNATRLAIFQALGIKLSAEDGAYFDKQLKEFKDYLRGLNKFNGADLDSEGFMLALYYALKRENANPDTFKITTKYIGHLQRVWSKLNQVQTAIKNFGVVIGGKRYAIGKWLMMIPGWQDRLQELGFEGLTKVFGAAFRGLSTAIKNMLSKLLLKLGLKFGLGALTGGIGAFLAPLVEKFLVPILRILFKKTLVFGKDLISGIATGDLTKAFRAVDKQIQQIIKTLSYITLLIMAPMALFVILLQTIIGSALSPLDPTKWFSNLAEDQEGVLINEIRYADANKQLASNSDSSVLDAATGSITQVADVRLDVIVTHNGVDITNPPEPYTSEGTEARYELVVEPKIDLTRIKGSAGYTLVVEQIDLNGDVSVVYTDGGGISTSAFATNSETPIKMPANNGKKALGKMNSRIVATATIDIPGTSEDPPIPSVQGEAHATFSIYPPMKEKCIPTGQSCASNPICCDEEATCAPDKVCKVAEPPEEGSCEEDCEGICCNDQCCPNTEKGDACDQDDSGNPVCPAEEETGDYPCVLEHYTRAGWGHSYAGNEADMYAHGSNDYWCGHVDRDSCNYECSYSIPQWPDKIKGPYNSNNWCSDQSPLGDGWGYAVDVHPNTSDYTAIAPSIGGVTTWDSSRCWNLTYKGASAGVMAGFIGDGDEGKYEMGVSHLVSCPSGSFSPGDQIGTVLSPYPTGAIYDHVHVELTIDGDQVVPESHVCIAPSR
ncbi:hypothetical protein A3K34_04510 [candidate division WWE3 bacterium RIFOXYC1_FULL_40_10]|uniref:Uncharacterized protein n=1 Tax=candidate division WWE3 bacterium RIFOXYA2_FULL_46_9 TaxID=1802636 RepID=A0A1F4W185_UNCKA|nr:MAG: hypothetical protein A3K58_04510 [candidate division WWE3 bacterium RIFOXYB1_FULL_40_22]OGC62105.1 MAG: hypothetical protein A3K37_04510 [candidate division WWE3 bacterium RIFOXYA1_FULL_40_11]OGC63120.1 MAG: hypothetical protein A2264_00255 [candidate division WWE3 bacterium RIFOXYA2_FULL_46_9]OGC64952.1 MAG: hypothetical protein A2326_02855 [candidate division WWE3 bacterium RIFOXYB2_FULL_41_6]OGC66488.1 MAG: hypothetical protein A3K34_04510 [candidate division WWE3 bacterium RIFOXYC1_